MKSLTLITKTKITADKVSDIIIESFKQKPSIVQNDEGELFLGFSPNEFYIIFDDSSSIEDSMCFFEEEDKKQIPFDNAQVNELYYHNEKVAKHVVKTLLNVYPELYLEDDQDGKIKPGSTYISD